MLPQELFILLQIGKRKKLVCQIRLVVKVVVLKTINIIEVEIYTSRQINQL